MLAGDCVLSARQRGRRFFFCAEPITQDFRRNRGSEIESELRKRFNAAVLPIPAR